MAWPKELSSSEVIRKVFPVDSRCICMCVCVLCVCEERVQVEKCVTFDDGKTAAFEAMLSNGAKAFAL